MTSTGTGDPVIAPPSVALPVRGASGISAPSPLPRPRRCCATGSPYFPRSVCLPGVPRRRHKVDRELGRLSHLTDSGRGLGDFATHGFTLNEDGGDEVSGCFT